MTDLVILFSAMLAVLCQLFLVAALVLRLAAFKQQWSGPWRGLVAAVGPYGYLAAFAVATYTTLGSLYMSEIANFMPCNLCWVQRAFIYPQVVLTGLLVWRPSLVWVRRLVLLLAGLCVPVSIYHYIIEQFQIESETCSTSAPCTQIWFEEFGFVTLPLMALTASLTIATLVLIRRSNEKQA